MAPSDYQDPDVQTPEVEVVDPADSDNTINQARQYWLQFQRWFGQLPPLAKGAVAIAVLFVSFSLLIQVLKFVASVVTLAILVVILYGLYRLLLQEKGTP